MVAKAVARGSASAIGWLGTIYVSDVNIWIPRFQYKLYQGGTVQEAAVYANGFTDYAHNTIKHYNLQGDGSTIIPHYGSRSAASLSEMAEAAKVDCLQEYTVKYPLGDDVEQGLIDSIAAATGVKLSAGGYMLEEDNSAVEGVSTYRIQIQRGDFETNTGFVLTVKNGTVVHIAHTTAENDGTATMSAAPTVTEADRTAAVAQANAEIAAAYPDATIIEQSGKSCYDVNTDTYYYRVFSTYRFEDGTKGGHITNYVVN